MNDLMIRIDHVSKEYRLGQIGAATLQEELQRLGARLRKKEDPTRRIGEALYRKGETFKALDEVSFSVKQGERVGIIGHNGAGKSTLLKLISRVTAPTGGTIGLNGRAASMLEVGTGFHPELTGRENIYMNGAILGMKKKEIDAKLEEIIDFSECRRFIDTPVKRYSSGMYVKLAFSVAAHLDAEIMIMDEVLAVGDMAFQNKCLKKMNDVSKAESRTILYVSHNMNTIRQLCDRCIVLDHGKIAFDGGIEDAIEIYMGIRDPLTKYVDLSALVRDPEFSPHPVTMQSIEMEQGTAGTVVDVGSRICVQLTCTCDRPIEQAFVRMIVKNREGTPVTMFTTDHGLRLDPSKNNRIRCTLHTERLVPGHYTLSPVIYEVNALGVHVHLDGLKEVIGFVLSPTAGFNHNMPWQPRYWGYLYNPPMETRILDTGEF